MKINARVQKIILILLLSSLVISICIDWILQILYKRYTAVSETGEQDISLTSISEEHINTSSRYEDFVERFEDVDMALEDLRDSNMDNDNISDTGIRYWELQVDTLYNYLLNHLGKEEADILALSQEEWTQSVDAKVNEWLSSNRDLEYFQGLSAIYRDRAYELLDTYKDVLDR